MERKPVNSSRVASIGWEANILEVEFQKGGIYQYKPVPQEMYNKLIGSYQVGVDLQAIINDKGIVCTKQ